MTPPRRAQPQEREPLRLEAALSGMLVLLVQERDRNAGAGAPKIEVVLARAGLSNEEIANVIGKKAEAVRKAIERAKG